MCIRKYINGGTKWAEREREREREKEREREGLRVINAKQKPEPQAEEVNGLFWRLIKGK
jgi:hypothetical protein